MLVYKRLQHVRISDYIARLDSHTYIKSINQAYVIYLQNKEFQFYRTIIYVLTQEKTTSFVCNYRSAMDYYSKINGCPLELGSFLCKIG